MSGDAGVSYYDLLGVKPTASPEEVKSAYREAARRYHPDRLGSADSHLFVLVGQAYQVLSNPARRAAYDRELSGPPPSQPPPQEPYQQPYQAPQSSSPSYSAPSVVPDPSDTRGVWPLLFLTAVAGGVVYDVLQHAGGWLAHPNVSTVFGFLTAGVMFVVGMLIMERLHRIFPRR